MLKRKANEILFEQLFFAVGYSVTHFWEVALKLPTRCRTAPCVCSVPDSPFQLLKDLYVNLLLYGNMGDQGKYLYFYSFSNHQVDT